MKIAALVIGIDHYTNTGDFPKLNCAVNDAREVAEKLRALKIDVEECLDEDNDTCIAYYDNFINKLQQKHYDAAIFYFAGHGEQPNLQDSLILKDAKRSTTGHTALLKQSFQVNTITKDLNSAGNQINILILDACRTVSDRGAVAAFTSANIKVPYQTFIAYSTTAGAGAKDGNLGEHSPFTQALLNNIDKEGLDIEMLFKTVRNEMFNQGLRQYPWDYSCLIDKFCFNHGQLHPHYGNPYSESAFSSDSFVTNSNTVQAILSGLQSGKNDRIDGAMGLLYTGYKSFTTDELFVMGRSLLEACRTHSARRYVNMTRLKLLAIGNTNPFLDGVMYAMYFDGKDRFREYDFCGIDVLDEIAGFWDNPEFSSSLKFIQFQLKPYADSLNYTPGNDSAVINLRVRPSEFGDNKRQIWVIEDLEFKGKNQESGLESSVYDDTSLREELKRIFFIPRRKIKLRTSSQIKKDDMIIPFEIDNIEETLDNYFTNGLSSDIDEMGHHYEFCCIEDFYITDLSNDDGFLFVKGKFIISVVSYLDSEEDTKNDVSLNGVFNFTMVCDDGKWNATDMYVKLDTRSYWT